MTTLYNLRSLEPNKYQLAKFDDDFNFVACYNLEPKGHSYLCDCPANQRSVVTKPCKHKRFLPFMLGAVNTDRFFDPETGAWCQPLGDLHREPPEGPEAQPEPEIDASTLLAAVEPPEGLVGEALGSSAEQPMTATEVEAAMVKAYEPVQRAAEAILEPIIDRVHALATQAPASPPAPTIRRR